MNTALAKEFLFEIDDIFKKYNITYCLDCGTLLGAIRDHDFIEWDDDLDFSIFTPIFLDYNLWKNINADFSEKNIHISTTWGDSVISLKKLKPGEVINADIHVYKKVDKEYQCAMMNNLFSFSEETFNTLNKISFQGREFNTPSDAGKYLSLFYGDNWNEPHPEIKCWTSRNCTPYYHEKISSYIRNEPIFNPKMDNKNKVSILIPTFNKGKLLEHTLAAYVQQNKPFNYEIIILNDYFHHDNTCTDIATETLVCKFLDRLNIYYIFTGQRNTFDTGVKWRIPGYAFNIGVKKATGNIILLTCPEILPLGNNCLKNIVSPLFTQNKMITHPITVKDDRQGEFLVNLEDNGGILTKTSEDYDKLEPLKPHYPFFLAMHKNEYVSIGGYDEDFTGNCFDDADICDRLKLNGCTFLPIAESRVLHLYHNRLNYKSKKVIEGWEYNKNLYYEREKIIIRNEGKNWGKYVS